MLRYIKWDWGQRVKGTGKIDAEEESIRKTECFISSRFDKGEKIKVEVGRVLVK